MGRITWEKYALNIAETAAQRSEDPHRQVGACALNYQNMVIGVGYNGLAPGVTMPYKNFWENRDHRRKFMIHAEANCLSLCKRGDIKLLAVTLLPCSYCATMISAYGIKEVYYKDIYEKDEQALEIFNFYLVKLIRLR
ncbi:MAG: deoxycytidylate deaminase [Parcubacteria group bacterium]|nr:deoxycytidylate deaminase [Parcubacteria group bacterium]